MALFGRHKAIKLKLSLLAHSSLLRHLHQSPSPFYNYGSRSKAGNVRYCRRGHHELQAYQPHPPAFVCIPLLCVRTSPHLRRLTFSADVCVPVRTIPDMFAQTTSVRTCRRTWINVSSTIPTRRMRGSLVSSISSPRRHASRLGFPPHASTDQPQMFKSLPQEEKRFWHSHKHEVNYHGVVVTQCGRPHDAYVESGLIQLFPKPFVPGTTISN